MRPVQLAVRFLLEVAALVALAIGVLDHAPGSVRLPATMASVVVAAVAWAVLRVPGDPGPAPVAIRGVSRLALELGLLAGPATLALPSHPRAAGALLVAIAVHYVTSGRIVWLLAR